MFELQLVGRTNDGGLWHTLRHADGSWVTFGDVKDQAGDKGAFTAAAAAGVAAELQLIGVTSDGKLWHTLRHADGSWVTFGDVKGQAGDKGAFTAAAAVGLAGELQLVGVTSDGNLWHTLRHADGSWVTFGDVKGQAGDKGAFTAVAAAGVADEVQLLGVTDDGNLWHTIRHADGSWVAFGDVKGQAGNKGTFTAVAAAGVAGELQLVGVTNDGNLWHTIRHADGSWVAFGDVKGQAGNKGIFTAAAAAGVAGELQLAGVTNDGNLWHTIRHADGSWVAFGDVKGQAGNKGIFTAAAAVDTNEPVDSLIKHVFVLMLENRSFDHMLGFSGIIGADAVTGQPTRINGLSGTEHNSFGGQTYQVSQPADFVMPVDPGHEFLDVKEQLCGPGGDYPAVNNSGFAANYAETCIKSGATINPAEIMKCYSHNQLPVLVALAEEFAVCDNWHASMPGPTWPNRFFLLAASSGGLDHSPRSQDIVKWDTLSGFCFEHGTIFDAIGHINSGHGWRIYAGDHFPIAAGLKGIHLWDIHSYDEFARDVSSGNYPWAFTFIEPNYGDVVDNTYSNGTSQHPRDDVTHGETLIKATYEAIRKSPLWNNSLLIVTWDEHGGFYDHGTPPVAVPPGDQICTGGAVNQNGFNFAEYGPRVPAVVASPLIARNVIDHRLYDHASVPATLETIFGLRPLTHRDASVHNLTSLVSLAHPRPTPATLPNPALSVAPLLGAAAAPDPAAAIETGNLPGFLYIALRHELAISPEAQRADILARYRAINTRAQARQYLDEMRERVRPPNKG